MLMLRHFIARPYCLSAVRSTNAVRSHIVSVSPVKCAYSVKGEGSDCNCTDTDKAIQGKVDNLVAVLDGYFENCAHHLNVNVLSKEKLRDALENPHMYPNLTLRISGYAVCIGSLTPEQRKDILSRTFHDKM